MIDATTIRALVFDLDGTLVDSRLDFPAMRAETGCPEGVGLLEFCAGESDPARRQRIEDIIHRHEVAGAEGASWMPGAKRLLEQLRLRQWPLAVFTRNSRESALRTIEKLQIPIEQLIAREDAPPKPDPGGLRVLIERWGLPANSVLMIGDFRYDIEAGANAGTRTCLYDPTGDSPWAGHADLDISHFDQLAGALDLE